jgi:hypothetical protein
LLCRYKISLNFGGKFECWRKDYLGHFRFTTSGHFLWCNFWWRHCSTTNTTWMVFYTTNIYLNIYIIVSCKRQPYNLYTPTDFERMVGCVKSFIYMKIQLNSVEILFFSILIDNGFFCSSCCSPLSRIGTNVVSTLQHIFALQ